MVVEFARLVAPGEVAAVKQATSPGAVPRALVFVGAPPPRICRGLRPFGPGVASVARGRELRRARAPCSPSA
eukprot:3024138-Alexandrium_andersonii.AAC.1